MPRPRTVSDDAILDATIQAVGRHGPGRMTLADVAEHAHLSPAAILARFGSKHALLLAVSARSTAQVSEAFDAALGRWPSPLRALTAVLEQTVDGITTPATLANHVAFLQLDLLDPELGAQARAHARALQRSIARTLDAAVAARELTPTDTKRLARMIYTTFNGALVSWAVTGRGNVRRWLRQEIEFALGPYRA